ncbi:PadR family transcriptional regulator [Deinococcus cellulosilyticus]|uniref:PadR family transcriptional regulator n=1 Tax=Deinococcus cellulosilyticus (strain DSM 18568 / NBRC 106333 / KACC 11606 / 5516J-15) TaxID=1223518 RepID=A0A511MYE3_DEIC1|nr:PadR family transcriptional regulator [Deinococcus cellulosilyticus]GEM45605.1 hypothetical protein DC3_12400 [Deinococcus cellulosilyticus NBRC 106333 = KACC 11606]
MDYSDGMIHDPNALLLLGLLKGEQQHGYQLHDFIEKNLAHFTQLKKATAYAALDRLEKAGLIQSHNEQAGNRPTRKVYGLTLQGEKHFLELLRIHLSQPDPLPEYGNLGMLFVNELPQQEVLLLLQERAKLLEQQIETLQKVPTHEGHIGRGLIGVDLTVSRQLNLLQADLEWLKRTLHTLQSQPDHAGITQRA